MGKAGEHKRYAPAYVVVPFQTEELTVSTPETEAIVDITERVANVVETSEIVEGICLVYCPHATAGITINENNAALHNDFLERVFTAIPRDAGYRHNEEVEEDNAHAHILTMIVGGSETVPVLDGVAALGTWQSVLLVEADGPQERTVIVQVLGE